MTQSFNVPDGISMDDLSSHLKDAPNEADIHDKCTCNHSTEADELIDIAQEQLQLTGRMTDDPVALHKIMAVMIISKMIDFHMNVAKNTSDMPEESVHAWIRDAGKFQAIQNILTSISCGPNDPYCPEDDN